MEPEFLVVFGIYYWSTIKIVNHALVWDFHLKHKKKSFSSLDVRKTFLFWSWSLSDWKYVTGFEIFVCFCFLFRLLLSRLAVAPPGWALPSASFHCGGVRLPTLALMRLCVFTVPSLYPRSQGVLVRNPLNVSVTFPWLDPKFCCIPFY